MVKTTSSSGGPTDGVPGAGSDVPSEHGGAMNLVIVEVVAAY